MRFERVGLSFASVGGASGVQALFLPAANIKGRIVRTLAIVGNGTGTAVSLYADTAAPTGSLDLTKNQIVSAVGGFTLTRELFLPAGYGLWVTAGNPSWAWASFDDIP